MKVKNIEFYFYFVHVCLWCYLLQMISKNKLYTHTHTNTYMYTYVWNVLYENGSCGFYFITFGSVSEKMKSGYIII